MAPSPHGPYWKEGMKLGYQDAGSWTLFKSTPVDRRKAAWLYAPVRRRRRWREEEPCRPDVHPRQRHPHKSFTERAPKLGGLVEFYRSPDRVAWTPTGINVPDYPKLAQLWWQNIGEAVAGEVTPDTAMDNLAREQDRVMERIERSGVQGECGPKLNPVRDEAYWLAQPGAPKPKLANEKPPGETVDYDQLMQAWKEGRVK